MTSIVNNSAANEAVLYINQNTANQNNLLAELSSGSRVVNAATDPASLAIGTHLQSDIAVLTQAATNAANAQSVLQTADGGLSQVANILQQMKSLAAEAVSGAVDSASVGDIGTAYTQLAAELTQIGTSTSFNGTSLLDGSFSQDFLIGTDSTTDVVTVALTTDVTSLTSISDTITDAASAETAMTDIAADIDTIATARATVGAYTSQFTYQQSVDSTAATNLTAAKSNMTDADVSQVESDYNNASVLTQAGIAALTDANQIPQDLLRLVRGQS